MLAFGIWKGGEPWNGYFLLTPDTDEMCADLSFPNSGVEYRVARFENGTLIKVFFGEYVRLMKVPDDLDKPHRIALSELRAVYEQVSAVDFRMVDQRSE